MKFVYLANLSHFLPELIVILTFLLTILIEATYKNKDQHKKEIFFVAFSGLLISLLVLILGKGGAGLKIFSQALVIDSFSTLVKVLMVLATAGVIYLSIQSIDIYKSMKSEFVIMTLGVLSGGMLLASANNLLIVYLGIETLSILSFVLTSLKKNDSKSSEAGLKYALYGAFASGISLFGMSFIYGLLGTINFEQLSSAIVGLNSSQLAATMFAFVLVFAGIGYKISSVPFHMWTPDVYEGAPIPVTTFFALVPKFAGIAAFLRLTFVFFLADTSLRANWIGLLHIICALTITVGNVTAIGQRSVKRMLAYSSISHAGMMMLGGVVIADDGVRAVTFYGITYLFMTLVAFFVTSFINDKYGNDDHDRFRGLVKRHPLITVFMSLCMFSLAGLPPLSGFVAKFNIISVIIQRGLYTLGFIAVINSVISLYYYMRVVNLMVFKDPDSEEHIEGFGFANSVLIGLLCLPVVGLGIFWEKASMIATSAKMFIK